MFKKFSALSLSLVVAAAISAGCEPIAAPEPMPPQETVVNLPSNETPVIKKYVPKELHVQFIPTLNTEIPTAKLKLLEKLLRDKLGIPVKVTTSKDYLALVDAMASKKVDIGFLPPSGYVLAHDKNKVADLLLQAQQYKIDDATGRLDTSKLVDYHKSMFIVKADSPINTIDDLKGKKIAWPDVTSATDYRYLGLELKKRNIDPDIDVKGIIVKGYDKGVLAVLHEEVDAAAIFQDTRLNLMKNMPDVFRHTRVLHFTAPLPNDTICVRNDMNEQWREKISAAFIAISKDLKGQQLIYELNSHRGYTPSADNNFNIIREANELMDSK